MHFSEDVILPHIDRDVSHRWMVISFHFKDEDPTSDIRFCVIPIKDWTLIHDFEKRKISSDSALDRTAMYFLMVHEVVVFEEQYQ